ncbi:MAG: type IV pilus biogenesis/stability protein PilW [Proteobacteria bacterium]|nr:type IV pilus biogenesis/stability protein PilW [Pseudomonadota bacterium]MDA0994916.1 type IV pilus biogenesis/stability protein PilW [Pseudomonadota bacterium]
MIKRATGLGASSLVTVSLLVLLAGCVSTSQKVPRSTEPNDDAGDYNYQLGTEYYRKGNYVLARDRLERAIELDQRNADYYSLHAMTLVQLGQHRLATESFDKATKIAPNNSDVRNAYAVYLCQQGKYDEARVQFDRAINIRENEGPYVMMTNAGVCVSKKPDLVLAEKYFRDAIAVRPNYGEALIQMAALKHRTEDNLSARAFMQRYLSANPPSSGVLYLAVQIETQLGDDRAATNYMNQLLREFPESAEARLMLRQG